MYYFFLLLAMTFSALFTICSRLYNNKNAGLSQVSRLFSMLTTGFAAFSWLVVWLNDFSFHPGVLPYSLLYGVGYSCFSIGMLGALKTGSTSLTALIKQVALVAVSFWGFLFWNTPFTWFSGIGIGLLILSLALCLITKEQRSDGHNMAKWLFYIALVFVGNATCSIVQRYQQMAFDYAHKNMFMFFSLVCAFVYCTIMALKEDKTAWKTAIKRSWLFPALAGGSSAGSNIFILLLIKGEMSPVILYPGVAVGGLIITMLVTLVFFREKLRPLQWVGIILGCGALVLLNL